MSGAITSAQGKFETVLTARDMTGPVIARMQAEFAKAGRNAAELGTISQRMGLGAIFGSAKNAATGAAGAVGSITNEVSQLGSRLTSLVPVLGGLSGLASIGGLFKLTADVAEGAEKSRNLAGALGIARGELGAFKFIAKQTGTDTDAMVAAMARLRRSVFAVARGEDKGLAGVFRELGVSVKDGKGQMRDFGAIVEDIYKVFEVNAPEAREWLAKQFFGKSGDQMIGFFRALSKEERQRLIGIYRSLKPNLGPESDLALREYKQEWVSLGEAVGAFKGQLGATLAPVLTPLLKSMRDYLVNHRDAIINGMSGGIVGALTFVENWWSRHSRALSEMHRGISRVATALGGWEPILSTLATLAAGRFLLSMGFALTRITGLAWIAAAAVRGVVAATAAARGGGAAASLAAGAAEGAGASAAARRAERKAAEAAEEKAVAKSVAGGAGGGAAIRWLPRLILRWGGPAAAFLAMMRPGAAGPTQDEESAAVTEYERRMQRRMLRTGETGSDWMLRNLPRIIVPNRAGITGFEGPIVPPGGVAFSTINAPIVPPKSQIGTVDVRIDITGLPQGARVQTESSGAAKPTVRLGESGVAFGGLP